jgi:hypothetical protein
MVIYRHELYAYNSSSRLNVSASESRQASLAVESDQPGTQVGVNGMFAGVKANA